jgi:hypothetical protein
MECIPSASKPAPRGALLLGGLLLIAVTLALYGASLGQPFTSDDYQYLHGCQRLEGASLVSVFHPSVQGVVLPPFYRPTSVAFFLGLSRLCGPQPAVFHGCLLLFRLVTVLLGLLLFSRLLGHAGWGVVAALALAVSPFAIEPGVWPAAVPDALLGVFLLAALLGLDQLGRLEARMAEPRGGTPRARAAAYGWLAGVVLCGLLALSSKEPAVVLPFLACCLPARRRPMGRAAILLLFAAVGLYLALRLWMRAHVPTTPTYDYWYLLQGPWQLGWWGQLALSLGILLTGPFASAAVLYGGLALAVGAVATVARAPRSLPRPALALALLFVLPLALTGGLSAPRYGYVPAMGTALILTGLARMGWRGRGRWLVGGLLASWLLFQASFSLFWIGEWGASARASQSVAQLLASRPADEETVLLWMPASRLNLFLGRVRCVSQALTDALYPAWMKTLAARGSGAVSLTMADGFSDAVPETQRVGPDVVEVSGGGLQLRPVTVSVYGGGTDLHISTYADLLALDAGRAQFRLKRTPGRAFFTLTEAGWLQL